MLASQRTFRHTARMCRACNSASRVGLRLAAPISSSSTVSSSSSGTGTNASPDTDTCTGTGTFTDKDQKGFPRITLSPQEEELFALFTNMVKGTDMGTTVRVAGGWVRDKLLNLAGKPDIDIALDNMSGESFAVRLSEWNASTEQASRLTAATPRIHANSGKHYVKFGVIRSNPKQSKHLDTATAQLGAFSIDFVNLRSEKYAQHSRIPQIAVGTPLMDAERRDLTINSLFYNLNTCEVEDFTGKGLDDLRSGRVSTPLTALTTLRDDPLRALRAVRFACRLQFEVATDVAAAARSKQVLTALTQKVSRERKLTEIQRMLAQRDVGKATRAAVMLGQLKLLHTIMTTEPLDALLASGGDSGDSNSVLRRIGAEPRALGTQAALAKTQLQTYHLRGICALLLHTGLTTARPTGNEHSLYTQELRSLQYFHRQKLVAAFGDGEEGTGAAGAAEAAEGEDELSRGDEHISWVDEHLRLAALTAGGAGWEQSVACKAKAKTTQGKDEGGKGGKGGKGAPSAGANANVTVNRTYRPLSDLVLLQNLRMSKKSADAVQTIHSAATHFTELLQELHAFNAEVESGATFAAPTNTEFKGIGKARLGLILRDVGALYLPALELAVAMHLLDKLVSTQLQVDALCTEGEALLGINAFVSEVLFGSTDSLSASFCLREAPQEEGGGTLLYSSLLTGPHVGDPAGDHVLQAARDLIAAIRHFDLHRDYDRSVTISSTEIREILPNLEAGPLYGQVLREIVRWNLDTPADEQSKESLHIHLRNTFPDAV